MAEFFDLTEDHLTLIKNLNVRWNEQYSGAPGVDCKRPYGNSDVEENLKKLLPHLSSEELMKVHSEMDVVLRIVLGIGKFVPGKYEQKISYDNHSWELVSSLERDEL